MFNVLILCPMQTLVHLVPWLETLHLGFTTWTGEYDGEFDSLLKDLTTSTVDRGGKAKIRWMQDLCLLSLIVEARAPHSMSFLSDNLVRLIEAHVPEDGRSHFQFLVEMPQDSELPSVLLKESKQRLDVCQQLGSSYKVTIILNLYTTVYILQMRTTISPSAGGNDWLKVSS